MRTEQCEKCPHLRAQVERKAFVEWARSHIQNDQAQAAPLAASSGDCPRDRARDGAIATGGQPRREKENG